MDNNNSKYFISSICNSSGSGSGNGLHVMMFPFLAFGHISPFLQLARKLSAVDPTIHITFLSAPANVPRISSLLPSSCNSNISVISLPLPPIPGLPPGAESTADLTSSQAELLKLAVDAMEPDVHSLLSHLTPNLVIFDFAQPWIPSIAAPVGIKTLHFSVFSAISAAYLTVPCRRTAGPPTVEKLKSPPAGFPPSATSALGSGVPTYQAQDFTYVFKVFENGKPCVYDRVTSCLKGCTAIIAKTCMEMEGQYIRYVEAEYQKPMLLAGPVVPPPATSVIRGDAQLEEKWAKWLEKFEEGSVVFCSFGSETLLKDEGIKELVLGLEMTGRPFVVVLNINQEATDLGSQVKKLADAVMEEEGSARGVVHHGWVQQQMILRHKSVGCFVCHAGFSSVVEGLVGGCHLVMLPQRGDQYLNSALFAGDLGIGVEVRRDNESGDFGREAICEAVQMVMMSTSTTSINNNNNNNNNEPNVMTLIKNIHENHSKWRDFFMDKGIEERFMVEFVRKLRAL